MIILDELKDSDIPDKLDYYKDLFIKEKIIGFNKFSLYEKDASNGYRSNHLGQKIFLDSVNVFIKYLSGCLDHEVLVTRNNQHHGQARISSSSDEKEYKDFIWSNAHSDISEVFETHLAVCRLVGMVMDVFNCPSEHGKTFFLDREKMLEETPAHIREWMKQIHVISLVGQKDGYGVNGMDWDGNIWPLRSMPGIVTHPITGVDNFAFGSHRHMITAEDMSLESEYEEFISDYLHDNSNWITWEWREGKAIIWDNFNLLHTYSPGWKDDERVFSRLQGGFVVPYYKYLGEFHNENQ